MRNAIQRERALVQRSAGRRVIGVSSRLRSSPVFERLETRVLLTSTLTAPYNAVTQWNASSNTKTNTWQYNYSATLGGAATPYPSHFVKTAKPTFDFWAASNAPLAVPAAAHNTSGGTITAAGFPGDPNPIIWPSNELLLAFGNAGEKNQYTFVRWLAPSSGTFNITGKFTDLEKSKVVLDVLHNGKAAFSSSFSGASGHQGDKSFNLTNVTVAKGDTIDFVAGTTAANSDCVVGLAANIAVSPPSDSIVASDSSAYIPPVGPVTTGSFTLTRSSVSAASTITASLTGTAVYNTDYKIAVYGATYSVNTAANILSLNVPAGSAPVVIVITPVKHSNQKASTQVVLTLLSGKYVPVAAHTKATVTITA
jgi:hypothetical protein